MIAKDGSEKSAQDNANMSEKMRAFRALSRRFREETRGTRQTPSEILIRRDRDGEQGKPNEREKCLNEKSE